MQSSELYFTKVPIPAKLLDSPDSLDSLSLGSISTDGRTTNQYIAYLAETAQVTRRWGPASASEFGGADL